MITFNETPLSPEILKAIGEIGFVNPTPVQEKMIPKIIESRNDVVALAQTGTGKTAAFGLPILQQINSESKDVQAIILCPTRELCIQISNDLEKFSKYLDNLRVVPVYGGSSIDTQMRALKKGCQIVVGTPGRTNDLIRRNKLKLSNIEWLVLDEADEMLSMGFKEELETILEKTPKSRQTLLFSATMPASIAKNYMNNPDEITIGKRNTGNSNVTHEYYMVHARDRYLALKRIADVNPDIYGIVFCRTRQETKDISDKLISDGYNADAIHGDLTQIQRDYVMNRFRLKNLQILVATDVAARGIDVNDLTHVINYNLPDDTEVYIHRSGRTGRAGKTGTSISIINMKETRKIQAIEKKVGKTFNKAMVPGGREICEKQLFHLIDKVENVQVDQSQIEEYLPVIYKKLNWLSREELIQHFVSIEFNRFLEYYKGAKDINVTDYRAEKNARRSAKDRRSGTDFTRFYMNVGSKHNINAGRLIGMINDNSGKKNIEIGKIEILHKITFFETDKRFEKEILNAFKKVQVSGVNIVVELANSKPDKPSSRSSKGRGRGVRGGKGRRPSKK